MRHHVGIDEAGYGPLLGPLVIGLCAFRLAPGPKTLPARLSGLVVRRPRKRARRGPLPVVVDDSKVLHARFGREGLARAVLAFEAARDRPAPAHLGAWLDTSSDTPPSNFQRLPWYEHLDDAPFPDTSPLPLLGQRFEGRGVSATALRVKPVDAARLNELFEKVGNKARVLGTAAGETLLAYLASHPDAKEVSVSFDRQGGRLDYAGYLADLFPFARITPLAAPKGNAHYDVRLPGRHLDVRFLTRGDQADLAVAWASAAAKLARELFLDCLNAWFLERAPGVKPTRGYVQDGRRFLEDVEKVFEKERIPRSHVVRSR